METFIQIIKIIDVIILLFLFFTSASRGIIGVAFFLFLIALLIICSSWFAVLFLVFVIIFWGVVATDNSNDNKHVVSPEGLNNVSSAKSSDATDVKSIAEKSITTEKERTDSILTPEKGVHRPVYTSVSDNMAHIKESLLEVRVILDESDLREWAKSIGISEKIMLIGRNNMLSRVEQIEVFKADIEQFNVKKQEIENMVSEDLTPSKKDFLRQEIKKVDYCIQSGKYMIAIFQNERVYDKVFTIITNFTAENLSELNTSYAWGHFGNYIGRRLGLKDGSLPFTSKGRYSGDEPPFYFRRDFDYLIELICESISSNKKINKNVLSLVCYNLIIDTAIERLSKAWSDLHPEFSEITSMEVALESYAELKSQNVNYLESYQFACWYVQNIEQNISPNALVVVIEKIDHYILEYEKAKEKAHFRKKMLAQDDEAYIAKEKDEVSVAEQKTDDPNTQVTMEGIDKLSGIEFERFIGQIFSDDGYEVEYTQTTNDKGIDIIAKRGGRSIGIQCKRYSTSLGVSAIQEVYAGQRFYSLDKAMVITNNYFTKAAIDMAESADVILWDRDFLNRKIQMMF